MRERYWLSVAGLPKQEATKEQFIQAERAAGFYPKGEGNGPATGGFNSRGVAGSITYEEEEVSGNKS